MKATTQLVAASILGTVAFANGINAPCHDSELMGMLAGRSIGETPQGEASSVALMKAWSTSWHAANLSN